MNTAFSASNTLAYTFFSSTISVSSSVVTTVYVVTTDNFGTVYDGDGVTVGVIVLDVVLLGVGVADAFGVIVGSDVGLVVGVTVPDGVTDGGKLNVGVLLGVSLSVGVLLGVSEIVGVVDTVGVTVLVSVGLGVMLNDTIGVGTGKIVYGFTSIFTDTTVPRVTVLTSRFTTYTVSPGLKLYTTSYIDYPQD